MYNENDYEYERNYLVRRYEDVRIVWKCDSCGSIREEHPDCNEGGRCSCGGTYLYAGESYPA